MLVRPAGPEDAVAVAAIHVASWRDAYASILDPAFLAGPIEQDRLTVWNDRLREPTGSHAVALALEEDQPIGFVCVLAEEDPQWGSRVDNLHVMPSLRGRGVGVLLLRWAAAWAAAAYPGSGLHLWVFEANTGARRFYERLGARTAGREASLIPSANGKTVLRLHWRSAQALAGGA
jgi:GNAT superfamily N-acetyltransferase